LAIQGRILLPDWSVNDLSPRQDVEAAFWEYVHVMSVA